MTECYLRADDESALCYCDNCGHECVANELGMIVDIQERLTPGETVPAGQCPECGALSYLKTPPKWSAEARIAKMGSALRSIRIARDYCAEHGKYADGLLAADQCFDDWAADLASDALA